MISVPSGLPGFLREGPTPGGQRLTQLPHRLGSHPMELQNLTLGRPAEPVEPLVPSPDERPPRGLRQPRGKITLKPTSPLVFHETTPSPDNIAPPPSHLRPITNSDRFEDTDLVLKTNR